MSQNKEGLVHASGAETLPVDAQDGAPSVAGKPWETEPVERAWVDDATGYRCQIKRHPRFLHLRGYVTVPVGHPAHGMPDYVSTWDYETATSRSLTPFEAAFNEISVHGGITYFDGKPDTPWEFGFDCAHAGDLVPSMIPARFPQLGDVYRDWSYVEAEVASFAAQLAALPVPDGAPMRHGETEVKDRA